MRTELVIDALAAAERTRGSLDGSIMHTDHGAQYTSKDFAAACKTAGVRQSMSKVGSSADNALAESFNATFKRETTPHNRGRLGRATRWPLPLSDSIREVVLVLGARRGLSRLTSVGSRGRHRRVSAADVSGPWPWPHHRSV